jgi:hypothetical protein
MRSETETVSTSTPRAGMRVSLRLAVPLVVAAAAGSGYLGARWAADSLSAELALRPPVILFDMAGAVRDVEPARLGAAVAHKKEQAKRLAAGGFLVLDAQAVIAAPPELYIDARAALDDVGGAPR